MYFPWADTHRPGIARIPADAGRARILGCCRQPGAVPARQASPRCPGSWRAALLSRPCGARQQRCRPDPRWRRYCPSTKPSAVLEAERVSLPVGRGGEGAPESADDSSALVAVNTATFHRNYSVDRTRSARPGSRSNPIGGGCGPSSPAGRAPGAVGPACSPAGGTCWRAEPARAR